MKTVEQSFQLSDEWLLTQDGSTLIVSGGADAKYEVDLEISGKSFFATLEPHHSFTRSGLNPNEQRVFEQLVANDANFDRASDLYRITPSGTPDIMLIFRHSGTYAELLADIDYQSINKPHLFVDTAYHHTLSLGPLVFPGETACIACLQGRISTRWGDDQTPESPRTNSRYGVVVADLVATELNRIASGDTSLTNKTVSWNFKDRTIKQNKLFKVPLCPICSEKTIDRSGALALPW